MTSAVNQRDAGRPAPSLGKVEAYGAISIAVGLSVLGLKYLAYVVTGSVALYSDAIESIANVATAIAALIAIHISAKPADANHPYGHSKVEYFSAVLEGVLIIVAALAIVREAWIGFAHPKSPEAPVLGLAINAAATILNALWSWVLITQGRKLRSPALVADGRHLLTDLWTSAGVFIGVILIAVTGWRQLDPLIAGLVSLNVIWSGWRLMQESLAGLMDHALPDGELAEVSRIVEAEMEGALEVHDLRSRQAGRMTFVDFHLVVDSAMSVSLSHAICDRIETSLKKSFPDSVISIHVEPAEKQKDHGGVHLMASA